MIKRQIGEFLHEYEERKKKEKEETEKALKGTYVVRNHGPNRKQKARALKAARAKL